MIWQQVANISLLISQQLNYNITNMADYNHEEPTLKEKILSAKAEGLTFIYCNQGHSIPSAADKMAVYANWTDSEFEEKLAEAVKRLRKARYLIILKEHGLIS